MRPALLLAPLLLAGAPVAAADAITRCDLAASHPDDPDRRAPGLERDAVDLKAAEAACRAAVAEAPEHARSAYHLGRVLFYQGRRAEAVPLLERSAAAGYRQSLFVLGFVLTLDPARADWCRAQALWRQAVGLEHPWSGYHLVEKHLDGRFAGCAGQVSPAELRRFMGVAADGISTAGSAGRVERLAARLAQAQ